MQLSKPRAVIIGGGFGGLSTAKQLRNSNIDVVLIDRANHHLFQPLLYQVATSALSPADIAAPIRSILRSQKNAQVIMNEALSINLEDRKVVLPDGVLYFDILIIAPGSGNSYFGNDHWEKFTIGLKSLKDALKIREMILRSFEKAERNYSKPHSEKYLNFIIIGGGPTGVEMAGSVAEISLKTMLPDFPLLSKEDIHIYLIEGGNRVLNYYTEAQSRYTESALTKLGVKILTNTFVTDINSDGVKAGDNFIPSTNIIWAAGTEASPLIKSIPVKTDKIGRALVKPDLTVPGYPNVFIIGDSSSIIDASGKEVPGIAPAAMQQGRYVANIIKNKISQPDRPPFRYNDKGSMATIGRAKAVAKIGNMNFKGLTAWLLWGFIHILFLIDFRNKIRVMTEWIWYYISFKPGARLIVNTKSEKNP